MYATQSTCAAPAAPKVRTIRLTQSFKKRSMSFGVCMFAVSGIARPIVANNMASTLLYARATGLKMSTSLELLRTPAHDVLESGG